MYYYSCVITQKLLEVLQQTVDHPVTYRWGRRDQLSVPLKASGGTRRLLRGDVIIVSHSLGVHIRHNSRDRAIAFFTWLELWGCDL